MAMIDYYIVICERIGTGEVASRSEYYSWHEADHVCRYINDTLKTIKAHIVKVYK